jgi:hypothetical protein
VTETITSAAEWTPEFLVSIYQDGRLLEQRCCDSAERAANVVESWEAHPSPDGELVVIEPRPPEAVVALLRAIADAIEQERPTPMRRPLPQLRLQLATDGTRSGPPRRGELRLLWQQKAHPGD